jgi:tocopherol cyclase
MFCIALRSLCSTPGLSVTAVGARRQLLLGVQGVEEDVGMLGIHLPNGAFLELVPWAGEVEWSADPWGRWWLRAKASGYEAVLEATCDADAGTVLRAPTSDNGLAPHCKVRVDACRDWCVGLLMWFA